jgi:carnitine O-acetyltransferase
MVESKGDYRQEAFLEDHIGGPLYEYQSRMPRLPVPSLADTLKRLLPTALPLARTEQERQAFKEAHGQFMQEQAHVLQERLLQRKEKDYADSSWLQEWWNQVCDVKCGISSWWHLLVFVLSHTPVCMGSNHRW